MMQLYPYHQSEMRDKFIDIMLEKGKAPLEGNVAAFISLKRNLHG